MTEQITFFGGREFRMSDTEYAIFGQDHWTVTPHLALDLGVRTESQEVSESFRVAPRAGFVWTPFAKAGTTIRGGFGMFYDRVPLNVYSFNHYPEGIGAELSAVGRTRGRSVHLRQHVGRGGRPFHLGFQASGRGRFFAAKRHRQLAGGAARHRASCSFAPATWRTSQRAWW